MPSSLARVSRNLRLVSLYTIASRVLGLVRDAAMAARFGNGPLLDAFTVAFRIPNLARALLGEGALATAFLPAFLALRNEHGRDAANRFAVAVLIVLAGLLTALVAVAELVLCGLGWGATLSSDADLLRRLLLILTPYVGLICVTSQLSALLHADSRFAIPAVLLAVLNLVWLLGLWAIVPHWSEPTTQLFAMAWCVVAAGVAQLLLPLSAVWALGYRYVADWRRAWSGVKTLFAQMAPVVGGLMITQVNVLLDSLIAWGFARPEHGPAVMSLPGEPLYPLAAGTASALYFGQRLYQFPLGVFGVALGTVLFPLLAEHAQRGDRERLREDFSLGLRLVAAIGIPASAGLMLLAGPLAALCFQYGAFDADDAAQTASMIAAYGSGVWAYCGLLIIHRGFYAIGDRMTPMRVGLGSLGLNLIGNLTLIWILGGTGLAVSTAVVSMLQCVTVGWLFRQRIGGWNGRAVAVAVLKSSFATLVMSFAVLATLRMLDHWPGWSGRGLRVLIPVAVAVVTYYATAWFVRFHEPWEMLKVGSEKSQVES
ncbi:MAG: murein biosynthesis integral membrane protein MurJ [Planctomycetaceae bacterium]|nr:murein biosynthesis integral membrane protein MurJ [Planctomycetaceae bacterium]